MGRHSFIRDPWIGIGSGNCKPAVGIRKLVCVQMQIVQRLGIVAARGAQKSSPERAQVLPSQTQVLVMVIRNEPQVTQAELRNGTGAPVGHRKQARGEASVLPGRVPGDNERVAHQLNRPPAREVAHRDSWTALPRGVALHAMPPCLVPELDVGEQKWTSTRPMACRRIQSDPKVPVDPHHIRQRARVAFPGHFRRLLNEAFVEFIDELETGTARPRWGHE